MNNFPALHLPTAHFTLQFAIASAALVVAALCGFAFGLLWPL
jgi:hypothetical protein